MKAVTKLWSETLGDLIRTWREVFLVHLVFTAFGFMLFSPLLGLIGRLLLSLSGRPALYDQDLAYFLLSPVGILSLILMAALLVVILVVEQAALMRLAVGVKYQQRVNVTDALFFALAKLGRLFRFVVILATRVLIMVLPFLVAAAGIIFFLITEYDINYYLTQKPVEFWWAAILVAGIFIAMVILLARKLLAWAMTLPMILFMEIQPEKSFSQSVNATQRNKGPIFITLLVWGVLAFLLEGLLLVTMSMFGSLILPFAGESISLLVLLLGAILMLWMLGNFLISTYASGSLAYLIIGLYEGHEPNSDPRLKLNKALISEPGKLQFNHKSIAIVLVAGVVVSGLTGAWLIDGTQTEDEVLIIAHRGAAGKAPENTLAAFHQAIEDQTDWIELDVQETADGEIVVFHDSDFMKLAGNSLKVWDATLTEIGEIDIGSWFDPEFSSERVPTLREVLEAVRGKVNVVIELKYYGHDQQLAPRVVAIVEAAGMLEQTAVMSLKFAALGEVRVLRPDWQIGLLSAKAVGNLARLDTDFLAVATGMASSGFIRRAHAQGKQVFVWTVNDVVTMSRMMSLGVDGIITDEPELARQVLEDRKSMNIAERLLVHTALLFGQPTLKGSEPLLSHLAE